MPADFQKKGQEGTISQINQAIELFFQGFLLGLMLEHSLRNIAQVSETVINKISID